MQTTWVKTNVPAQMCVPKYMFTNDKEDSADV